MIHHASDDVRLILCFGLFLGVLCLISVVVMMCSFGYMETKTAHSLDFCRWNKKRKHAKDGAVSFQSCFDFYVN